MKSPYQRMLRLMEDKERSSRPARREKWFLYIVECNDGTFYTGITKDIERRVKTHNNGKGASFTRARRPVKMIYQETLSSRTQALVREYAVKTLSRREKEILVLGGGAPKRPRKRAAPGRTAKRRSR